MQCPMKFNCPEKWNNIDCEKEKCEWWDEESKCCVIKHLRHIDCLVDAICLLHNKGKKEDL